MSAKEKIRKTESVVSEKKDFSQEVLDGILEVVGNDGAQLLGSDGLAIKIKGVISTQCPTIDAAIGRGGIPRGRLTVLHGSEGSGKTTLALHIAAETQRIGGVVVYIDKEYKLDPDYAAAIGVDVGRMIIAQPSYLEKVFETIDGVIKRSALLRKAGKKIPILIVLDSMNSAITKEQFQGDWEQKGMAQQARVYSMLLPKLIPQVSNEDVALLFISQIRKKMNVMFGNDSETAGGSAPRFYASVIAEVGRRTAKTTDGVKSGNDIEVYFRKNQIAPPFRKAKCEIVYGVGIDKITSLVEQAVLDGIAEKKGTWFNYGSIRLGQGMSASVDFLKENPKLIEEIYKKVKKTNKW